MLFFENGQIVMRVYIHIPMAGKMLGAGHNARFLHATGIGRTIIGNLVFILPKGTEANHGIIGVVVDVNHRRIVYMHPQSLALPTHGNAHTIDQFLVGQGAEGELIRKFGHAIEAHTQPPFPIDGDHQWRLRHRLVSIGELCLPVGTALKKTKGTHIVALNIFGYFGHMIGSQIAMRTNYHQLRDALIGTEAVKNTINPILFAELAVKLRPNKKR